MEILDTIWVYIEPVWLWLLAGAEMYGPVAADGGVNWLNLGAQMGVIALIMALLMQAYGAILVFTVVGVIVHVIVDQVMPMVLGGADFAIPPVTAVDYWQYLAFAAAGYFVAITVLFILKSLIFRGD
ncbi:MAG: hypothetical protein AAFX09_01870 [Pseudomonadota bacterium]